jgi:hypothetical protein
MNTVECSNCEFEFDDSKEPEVNMGYVLCPYCGWWVDQWGASYPPPTGKVFTK